MENEFPEIVMKMLASEMPICVQALKDKAMVVVQHERRKAQVAAGLYVDDDDAEMLRTNEIKSEDEEESYYSESEEGMESEDYDSES